MKRILLFLLILNAGIAFGSELKTELLWEYQIIPYLPLSVLHDNNGRDYLYATVKNGGLMIFDVAGNQKAKLIKTMNVSEFDGLEVINLTQEGNYLYLALGNFVGTSPQPSGLAVIDITNPANPKTMSKWNNPDTIKGSAVVTFNNDYVYLGAMSDGIYIFDVSNKSKITEVSHYIPDKNFPVENPTATQEPNARGMAVVGDLLYLCYDAGGLRIIDISNKQNPKEISRYINKGVPNKQQAYNNVVISGNYAFIGIDYCGVEVLDISDAKNIKQAAWWNPWDCDSASNVWFNSKGHTNEVRLSPEGKYLFVSAGDSELIILNVSDPENPTLAGSYGEPGNKLGCWGTELRNNTAYLTYINALIPFFSNWSGIKAVHWDKPTEVKELTNQFQDFKITCNGDEIKIVFKSLQAGNVKFELYDFLGRQVYSTASNSQNNDEYIFNIGKSGIMSIGGIYCYRLHNGNNIYTGLLPVY